MSNRKWSLSTVYMVRTVNTEVMFSKQLAKTFLTRFWPTLSMTQLSVHPVAIPASSCNLYSLIFFPHTPRTFVILYSKCAATMSHAHQGSLGKLNGPGCCRTLYFLEASDALTLDMFLCISLIKLCTSVSGICSCTHRMDSALSL